MNDRAPSRPSRYGRFPSGWASGRIALAASLIAATALLATSAPAASSQFTPFEAALARFDAEVAGGAATDAAGCVSVAVFIGNDVIWAKGYGWADIENRVACTADTIGRTGSISKSFTAVAMMQLVERGIFGLDDPVADYFPQIADLAEPAAEIKPITFRMLSSHTAGLIREPRLEGAASGSIYRWEEKILESIPNTGFLSPPATEYSYSNIGFGILGLASSRAAGVPFMELVTDQIFKPLGMTSSTFIVNTPELAERLSVGYMRDRRSGGVSAEWATREHFGRGYKVPNGGIYSTVGDLAKFAAAMMGESPVEILSPASRDEVFTPQVPATGYGLGFSIREADGMKIAGHGGSVAGYNANLSFDLRSKIGVSMLRTTSYNPPTGALLRELVAAGGRALTDVEKTVEATAWLERIARRRTVAQLNRGMEEAFSEGDMEAVADYYADDALMVGPGTRVEGKAAILDYWTRVPDPVSWRLEIHDLTGSEEIVHQTGRSTLVTGRGGDETTSIVDFVLVWKKQPDGGYKILVDSYHDPEGR